MTNKGVHIKSIKISFCMVNDFLDSVVTSETPKRLVKRRVHGSIGPGRRNDFY